MAALLSVWLPGTPESLLNRSHLLVEANCQAYQTTALISEQTMAPIIHPLITYCRFRLTNIR